MKLSAAQIIAALPLLTGNERSLIHAALAEMGQAADSGPHSLLYGVVADLTGTKLPYSRFTVGPLYKHFKGKAQATTQFIDTCFGWPDQRSTHALMRMLVEGLISDLTAAGVTPSLRAVVLQLDKLPQVFDRMFPGYRQSGAAKIVLESMIGKGAKGAK
jgi:hypothetical protein